MNRALGAIQREGRRTIVESSWYTIPCLNGVCVERITLRAADQMVALKFFGEGCWVFEGGTVMIIVFELASQGWNTLCLALWHMPLTGST